MSFLLTQDWDIIRGKEDAYSTFVSKRFIPQCNTLGLQAVGGFYVQVGVGPQIISIKSVQSLESIYQSITKPEFQNLKAELCQYVVNYSSKILQPSIKDRNAVYEIQKGVWKFNQYYDVLPDKKTEYHDYIRDGYIPAVEQIEYVELTEIWDVLIGGFSEMIIELTFQDPVDIGMIFDNKEFRELTYTLRRDYVRNYKSRILRTTERFDEPRWFRL